MTNTNTSILTLVVCTYNRVHILEHCLSALANQSINLLQYQVLLINNNSTDHTQAVIDKFTAQYPNFSSVIEPKQGLSYARNRGYQEAQTAWVAYLDDDAKAHPNYVERALWVIENYNFDCFGGMYYAWHKFGKPKWLPDDFGTKPLLLKKVGFLKEGMLSGGNILFKKEVLIKIGGFETSLGMKGNELGYCEEDSLQKRLRKATYTIGFDPLLAIDHIVMPDKLKYFWHIKFHYFLGRDKQLHEKESFIVVLKDSLRTLLSTLLLKFPTNLYKCVSQETYYLENVLIDTFQILALRLGQLSVFYKKMMR